MKRLTFTLFLTFLGVSTFMDAMNGAKLEFDAIIASGSIRRSPSGNFSDGSHESDFPERPKAPLNLERDINNSEGEEDLFLEQLLQIKLSKLHELATASRIDLVKEDGVLKPKKEAIPNESLETEKLRSQYLARLKAWEKQVKEMINNIDRQHLVQLSSADGDGTYYICDALHFTVKLGNKDMVEFLLERGANKDKKDHLNRKAAYYILDIEDEHKALEVAKLLVKTRKDLQAGNPFESPLQELESRENLLDYYSQLSS